MHSPKISAICILLSFSLAIADVHIVFNKTENYYGKTRIVSANIYNSMLTVVSFDTSPNTELIRKRNVTQTSLDNENQSFSCEILLDNGVHDIRGYPLTTNKAILVSNSQDSDEEYDKYVIINFPDCKTVEVKINFDNKETHRYNFRENEKAISINGDDTFDILYNDAKICGMKTCRLTIDSQGKKVKGPSAAFIPVAGAKRFVKKVPSSSNFIVTQYKYRSAFKKYQIYVSLIKPDGQVVLTEYKNSYGVDDFRIHSVSTTYESIRVCKKIQNATKVDCELFDDNGKVITKVSIDVPEMVENLVVENLANGEFLLLAESYNVDNVMKIKSEGSVVGAVKLTHFEDRFSQGFYYDAHVDVDDNRYCVTRKAYRRYDLEVLKECFDDGDFH